MCFNPPVGIENDNIDVVLDVVLGEQGNVEDLSARDGWAPNESTVRAATRAVQLCAPYREYRNQTVAASFGPIGPQEIDPIEDGNEEARGPLAHVMFAYFCPTNDDEISVHLAQQSLDELDFHDATAQEAFDTLEGQQPEVSEMSQVIGCSMVERIERDHPHQ